MKKPTLDAFYYSELAQAAQATINQLEQWVTRKLFLPVNPTVAGRSRAFTDRDACRCAIMAYIVNRCGLPVGIGSYVAEMLRDQTELMTDLLIYERHVFAIVFPDAAASVTRLPTQASIDAITFAVGWDDNEGSVAAVLQARDPAGVTIVNMSRVARAALGRLAKAIDAGNAFDDALKTAGNAHSYNDVEE